MLTERAKDCKIWAWGLSSFLVFVRSEGQQKETTYFLIVLMLTTDPVFRFLDEDYPITNRYNLNGVA